MRFIQLTDYEGKMITVNPECIVMMIPSPYDTRIVFGHFEVDVHESVETIIEMVKEG